MGDRKKPGRARAWSAKRAKAALYAAQRRAFDRHMNGHEGFVGADELDERALAKAYLDGIKAARDCDETVIHGAVQRFHDEEAARLGMAPKPTGTGKGVKRGRGEGRK